MSACAQDPGKVTGCRTDGDCTRGEVCIPKTGVCQRFNRPLEIDASVRDAARMDAAMRMDAARRDGPGTDGPRTDGPGTDGPRTDASAADASPRG